MKLIVELLGAITNAAFAAPDDRPDDLQRGTEVEVFFIGNMF